MTNDDARALLARLLHRIAPEVDLADAADGESLQEAFDLDSMDFLNLVTALHDDAGIDIPEADYPKVGTIGTFIAYVAAAS